MTSESQSVAGQIEATETAPEPEQGNEDLAHKPYNPDEIRVDPKTFSLRQVVDYINDSDIDLVPDFQRGRVWRPRQKVRLIESVLLRIPLPAFYFDAEKSGLMHVVDGLQRLSTIHDFVSGRFALEARYLEYLQLEPEVAEKTFEQLGPTWKRRVNNTQIIANVIDPQTPTAVKFDIFKRINTGGSPLTAQEMRHCMMGSSARERLKKLASLPDFRAAVPKYLHGDDRMEDREIVLRFVAFTLCSPAEYAPDTTMDEFLTRAAERLQALTEVEYGALETRFATAMEIARSLFGDRAFRKWPLGNERYYPLNKPLFETISAELAALDPASVLARKNTIVMALRSAFKSNAAFADAITVGTSSSANVQLRFRTVGEILRGAE